MADRLVGTCAELLDIRAAGILLDDQQGHLRLLASSDEETRLLELIQLQANEGPCLDAFSSGELVAVPDLAKEQARWPRFAPQAVDDGVLGVYALPLRLRDRTIGALNLFRAQVGALPPRQLQVAQVLAGMATVGLTNQRTVRRQELLAEQLQFALNSRIVIEQAKGVVAERAGVDVTTAFALLRDAARAARRPISEVAGDVARGKVGPQAFTRQGDHIELDLGQPQAR